MFCTQVYQIFTLAPAPSFEIARNEGFHYCYILFSVGFPIGKLQLRYLAQDYLNKLGRAVEGLTDNLPGKDWALTFVSRHENITLRQPNNMNVAKAQVLETEIESFFSYLKISLTNPDGSMVPPSNIFNFDETNFQDNPGRKKLICKKGIKYFDRIINTTKTAHSVMLPSKLNSAI